MDRRNIRKAARTIVVMVVVLLAMTGAAWALDYTPVVKGGAKPG